MELEDLENNPKLARKLIEEFKIEQEKIQNGIKYISSLTNDLHNINSNLSDKEKEHYSTFIEMLNKLKNTNLDEFLIKVKELQCEIGETLHEREERIQKEKRIDGFLKNMFQERLNAKIKRNNMNKSIICKDVHKQ